MDPGQRGAAVGHGESSGMFSAFSEGRVVGGLDAVEGLHEQPLHQGVLQIGDQINIRVFQHHGDGGGLVAAQPEFPLDPFNQRMGGGRRGHPLLKGLFAQALLAGADQHDHAAGLHRVLGVVQGLLGLIQVQVLGCTALIHQNDVCTLRDLLAVQGVQEGAARPVGGHLTFF